MFADSPVPDFAKSEERCEKIPKSGIYARRYRTPRTAPISTKLTISERLSSKIFYNEFH